MQPEKARAIDRALGDLSLDDRLYALMASIIMRKEGSAAVIRSLAVLAALSVEMNLEERTVLAELVRDVADRIERRHETVAA